MTDPTTPRSLLRPMMIAKIHRATITGADLHYVGSITVDADLLDAADLLPGQQVDVVDVTNGARLTTYVLPGERGTGILVINGAAAHHVRTGDLVIVIAYGQMSDDDARSYTPHVVFVDGANRILDIGDEPGQVPDVDAGEARHVEPSGVSIHSYREELPAARKPDFDI
ncbi:aspartate 1-decarboxylase [Georgenia sp. TF02-10]|uniref:aspartate 1-decarboxylase n=1 Tax=Georgenia sp. TF02-10 TaxID=2917725 RepID=UPI001FA7E677|nr:aspartate 1-decarboxylase [Georgenia sp. TF02-10]UNX54480.1 aspartate 1-decarboxylase [Georgenia sp. TF02-10]